MLEENNEFLEKFTKHGIDFNENDVKDNSNGKKVKTNKRYQHRQVITELIKTIETCKMDEELKMILRMRIWGVDSEVFRPMTCEEIAKFMKVRLRDVESFECEAKRKLEDHLSKNHISDIIFTYDKAQLGGNVLYDSKGRKITE